MKNLLSLPVLLLLVMALGCEGPQGDVGTPGEAGPTGESGPTGADGLTGPMGSVGETGATGDNGSSGADGESCSATDNGDGTYVVNCPDSGPIILNEGEAIHLIE